MLPMGKLMSNKEIFFYPHHVTKMKASWHKYFCLEKVMITLIHSSNSKTEMQVFDLLFTFDKVNSDLTLKSQLNFPLTECLF